MYDHALQFNLKDAMFYFSKGNRYIWILGNALYEIRDFNEAIRMYDHAL